MRFAVLLIVAGSLCACNQSIVTTDFSGPQAAPQVQATVQDCRQPGDLLEVFSIQVKQITWRAGKFYIVFTLENMSTSPARLYVDSSSQFIVTDIYLLNQQGVKYGYDMAGYTQIAMTQVNPGMTMDLKLDFSAPKDEYTFHIDATSMSNTAKTAFVCHLAS
jgi:hypothetical protein